MSGLTHQEVRDSLILLAEQELDPPVAATVEEHLAACAECRLYRDQLESFRGGLDLRDLASAITDAPEPHIDSAKLWTLAEQSPDVAASDRVAWAHLLRCGRCFRELIRCREALASSAEPAVVPDSGRAADAVWLLLQEKAAHPDVRRPSLGHSKRVRGWLQGWLLKDDEDRPVKSGRASLLIAAVASVGTVVTAIALFLFRPTPPSVTQTNATVDPKPTPAIERSGDAIVKGFSPLPASSSATMAPPFVPPNASPRLELTEQVARRLAVEEGGLELRPGETDRDYQARAKAMRSRYDNAVATATKGPSREAIGLLEGIARDATPGYLDVSTQLANARRAYRATAQKTLADARNLASNEKWNESLEKYKQALEIDPSLSIESEVRKVNDDKLEAGHRLCTTAKQAQASTPAQAPGLYRRVLELLPPDDACSIQARQFLGLK